MANEERDNMVSDEAVARQAAADDVIRSQPLQSKSVDLTPPQWLRDFDARQTFGDLSVRGREFLDRNVREIRAANTIITGAAVLFVISRSRAFKRVSSARKFPDEWFANRRKINGRVVGLRGDHLLVRHEPWLRRVLRWFTPFNTPNRVNQTELPYTNFNNKVIKDALPVRIFGIECAHPFTQHWLQNSIVNPSYDVKIELVQRDAEDPDMLVGQVSYRTGLVMGHKDLAIEIVSQGGARVLNPETVHCRDELQAFAHAKELVSSLEKAEREADRAGRGVWQDDARRRREKEATKARAAAVAARQRARVVENVSNKGKVIGDFVIKAARTAALSVKEIRQKKNIAKGETENTSVSESTAADPSLFSEAAKYFGKQTQHDSETKSIVDFNNTLLSAKDINQQQQQSEWVNGDGDSKSSPTHINQQQQSEWVKRATNGRGDNNGEDKQEESRKSNISKSQINSSQRSNSNEVKESVVIVDSYISSIPKNYSDKPRQHQSDLIKEKNTEQQINSDQVRETSYRGKNSEFSSRSGQGSTPDKSPKSEFMGRMSGVAGLIWNGGKTLTDRVVKPVGKVVWRQGVKAGEAAAEALIEREKRKRRGR